MQALARLLKEKDIPICEGISTAKLCTFRIGGIAPLLARPTTQTKFVEAIRLCRSAGKRFVILGRGSNVLFGDGTLDALLIQTTSLTQVAFDSGSVFAECGTSMMRLCDLAADRGLAGFSFAAGIPGSIGGGIYMNAGAHGKCVFDVIKSVTYYDIDLDKIKTEFNHQLNSNYRYSCFQGKNAVILSATLTLCPGADRDALKEEIRRLRALRRATQPLELPNAGSTFRRPEPMLPVGRLLDELLLKGKRIGDAAVSQKHAGFIVNLGAARATDVLALIREIQNTVKKERGITLEPELCVILSRT